MTGILPHYMANLDKLFSGLDIHRDVMQRRKDWLTSTGEESWILDKQSTCKKALSCGCNVGTESTFAGDGDGKV